MERITSAQNSLFKIFKQLATQSKTRKQLRQTIFEGVHVCDAYLQGGEDPLYCIVSDAALQQPEVTDLVARLASNTPIVNVPDSLFSSMSAVDNGVGVAFVVDIPTYETVPALTDDALLIEAVQDPGNLGTLLRTSAAAGVKNVYLSAGSASAWAPKTVRAAMGAHMHVTIYEHADLAELIKSSTVPVRATTLQATNSLYDVDLTVPTAWIMGNEGAGVSEALLTLCSDNAVIIPQDASVESLNVAAAAAVCLFEQRRQRA